MLLKVLCAISEYLTVPGRFWRVSIQTQADILGLDTQRLCFLGTVVPIGKSERYRFSQLPCTLLVLINS